MNLVALQMLFGDRAKYFGIVMGVTLATMVITQQGSIFVGLMTRTFALITDMPQAKIWVMDPKVQFIDDVKPLQDTELQRVRSVQGVEWAVPFYKGLVRVRMDDGTFQNCNLYGIDDATLIGGPQRLDDGSLMDLRRSDAVIIDRIGSTTKLARPMPDGTKIPAHVGSTLEINDSRGVVVGVADALRTFQSQPIIWTTFSRAMRFAPRERKMLSFVLVSPAPGQDEATLCKRITESTGLAAYTNKQFAWLTVMYFVKNTGIPINFGIAVMLGLIVGAVITGFMFYSFTLDNLRYFGTLKAMGARDVELLWMIVLQALIVGMIGWGLGVGLASLFGSSTRNSPLAFRMIWQLLFVSGAATVVICVIAAMLSIRRVVALEPAVVFKG